ncbi:hypothetical protein [Micropruina sp.]|uniref:hypothetical protein n=1 Tax=Micropruina sp. TaxID=2737536 RepID=UPI0039E41EB7
MSAEEDARRLAAGPSPSRIVRSRDQRSGNANDGRLAMDPAVIDPAAAADAVADTGAAATVNGAPTTQERTFDPLRLCIFATVALLGWVLGPFALLFFAGLGFAGYWRARRAGLTRSKCVLRDTRLVLAYLGLLAVAAGWGCWQLIAGWFA